MYTKIFDYVIYMLLKQFRNCQCDFTVKLNRREHGCLLVVQLGNITPDIHVLVQVLVRLRPCVLVHLCPSLLLHNLLHVTQT